MEQEAPTSANPLPHRRGKQENPSPAKDTAEASTLSQNGEGVVECDPLPQREQRERAGSKPAECSSQIDVTGTPMEVA